MLFTKRAGKPPASWYDFVSLVKIIVWAFWLDVRYFSLVKKSIYIYIYLVFHFEVLIKLFFSVFVFSGMLFSLILAAFSSVTIWQNERPFWKRKAKDYSHWPVTIASETVILDQSECRKINSHLEIYTKHC